MTTLVEHVAKLAKMEAELDKHNKAEASLVSDDWSEEQWDDHIKSVNDLELEVYEYKTTPLKFIK